MQETRYLPLEELKVGGIYRVEARNFKLAVFDGRVFWGVRHKWGAAYLDDERHWDEGAPHGTVKPLELVGETTLPVHGESAALFDLLVQKLMEAKR